VAGAWAEALATCQLSSVYHQGTSPCLELSRPFHLCFSSLNRAVPVRGREALASSAVRGH